MEFWIIFTVCDRLAEYFFSIQTNEPWNNGHLQQIPLKWARFFSWIEAIVGIFAFNCECYIFFALQRIQSISCLAMAQLWIVGCGFFSCGVKKAWFFSRIKWICFFFSTYTTTWAVWRRLIQKKKNRNKKSFNLNAHI